MKETTMKIFTWIRVLVPVLLLASALPASAAWLSDMPVTLHQPDGTPVPCLMTGDEFFRWAHDSRGFVITEDPADGRLVYAVARDGRWAPSAWAVGTVDPAAVGLTSNLPIPVDAAAGRAKLFRDHGPGSRLAGGGGAKIGQFNNIVVFVRFAGELEFTDPISQYSNMYNDATAGANSMYRYYQEVSYGQLSVQSRFYPQSTTTVLSYQDTAHQRGYYSPWSLSNQQGYSDANQGIEGAQRLHKMLVAAVKSIASQVPADLNVDRDGDGYVDNVCFIAKGTSDNWNDMLWPHMWWILEGPEYGAEYIAYINNKKVGPYNLQLQEFLRRVGTGVLCHEMFHSLGAPDLYRYKEGQGTFTPVGGWDLMEGTRNPPQHMLSYMKARYGGWINSIPLITTNGPYTLQPVTSSTNNCFRINSSRADQYYVVEYRSQASSGFEAGVPGSGLIVYRINTNVTDGSGNMNGPPDEVYVYRPGGTNSVTGLINSASLSADSARTSITDDTDPSGFLADGQLGGLRITQIGPVGATITFTVESAGGAPACATVAGDASGDDVINVADILKVVDDILQTQTLSPGARICADIAPPLGSIDIFDVIAIVDLILHPGASRLAAITARAEAPPPPLSLRAERADGTWRLTFAGSGVAGIQAELPFDVPPSVAPRLEGASSRAVVGWDFQRGKLRLLVYAADGGSLGAGTCTLVVPARAAGGTVADGVVSDEDLVLDGALRLSPVPGLLFAGTDGGRLPFVLAGAGDVPAPAARPRITLVEPNPSRGAVRLRLEGLPPGAVARVRACDAVGRLVAGFALLPAGADGSAVAEWDGHDLRGAPLPTGAYFLVLEGAGSGKASKILLLR
jgi:M6 family metalloprotease-like protein